jgi:hypothetical protein
MLSGLSARNGEKSWFFFFISLYHLCRILNTYSAWMHECMIAVYVCTGTGPFYMMVFSSPSYSYTTSVVCSVDKVVFSMLSGLLSKEWEKSFFFLHILMPSL